MSSRSAAISARYALVLGIVTFVAVSPLAGQEARDSSSGHSASDRREDSRSMEQARKDSVKAAREAQKAAERASKDSVRAQRQLERAAAQARRDSIAAAEAVRHDRLHGGPLVNQVTIVTRMNVDALRDRILAVMMVEGMPPQTSGPVTLVWDSGCAEDAITGAKQRKVNVTLVSLSDSSSSAVLTGDERVSEHISDCDSELGGTKVQLGNKNTGFGGRVWESIVAVADSVKARDSTAVIRFAVRRF